jgi:hypothetical protein
MRLKHQKRFKKKFVCILYIELSLLQCTYAKNDMKAFMEQHCKGKERFMESRKARLVVAIILAGMCSLPALALPPMGPPKATLEKNQWAIDLKYAYQQMDLELDGKVYEKVGMTWVGDYTEYKIKALRSNMLLGSVDYGIYDNWDAFVHIGVTDAKDEIEESLVCGASGNRYYGFSGDYGLNWGFGTRATFCQEDNLIWGGLFQMTWSNPGESSVKLRGDPTFSGDVELDFWEIQVVAGPTLQLDGLSIYGGPFLHFVKGDWDLKGVNVRSSADIREESIFGAYCGLQWDIDEETCWYMEYQFTNDAWGVGTGIVWKF